MMPKAPILFFFAVIILFFNFCHSANAQTAVNSEQSRSVDSLLTLINKDNADTNQVIHLLKLSTAFQKAGNTKEALKYVNKALALSGSIIVGNSKGWAKGMAKACLRKGSIYEGAYNYPEALKNNYESLKLGKLINDKAVIANAYNSIGTIYSNQSNYVDALSSFFNSLDARREINDNVGIANSYKSIGNIYYYLSDYSEALKYYLATLKIAENIKDKNLLASSYNNIANIYFFQKDYSKALSSFNTSIKIRDELHDSYGIALIYNNIGQTYSAQENDSEALTNFRIALKAAKENNIQNVMVAAYSNIGNLYYKQKKYNEAQENYINALEITKKNNDKYSQASILINLSALKVELKETDNARKYLNEALQMSIGTRSKELIQASNHSLAIVDSILGNWKDAYEHQKIYSIYKDSIDNEENRKKAIKSTLAFEYEKKEATLKVENKRINDRQITIVWLIVSLVFTIFPFLIITIYYIITIRKQKQTIEAQKQETEIQKKIIEEKSKSVLDSIHYAKRIQNSLLGKETYKNTHLPEHFVIYKPKDIVSGDFYWNIEKQGYWYLAVADCTGHGVPGGFMSMLGIAFLNEITATTELLTPSQILDLLRAKIVKELGQGENNQSKDGMDISLIRYNIQTRELQWAGANTPLYIIQTHPLPEEEGVSLSEIKADKQPIGYYLTMKPFTNHTLQLETGSRFYLFTDGYADQFGGIKGKKFMYKNLKNLLLSTHIKTLPEQKEILNNTFDTWKDGLDQVDDVCIVGVSV
jgi:tetratricopeptide (TPR) repeat protein